MPNFTPIGATCRPCGAKKPQNWPLSKLNTGRFALRAMLPVTNALSDLMTHAHSSSVERGSSAEYTSLYPQENHK